MLLPHHTKLKEQISEVLDADLIRQQAEKGILDFQVSDEILFFISSYHPSSFSVFCPFSCHLLLLVQFLFFKG
jgi:hypothetical protein